MTILGFTNFGMREVDWLTDSISNIAFNTTIKKNGRQSLHIGSDGLSTTSNYRVKADYLSACYWFYLRIITLPSSYCELSYEYNVSGSHALRLYSDGKLGLWTNGSTVTMSTSALSLNTWYKISIVHTGTSGANTVTVYVDNTSFASRSLPRGWSYVRIGKTTATDGEYLINSYVAATADDIGNYDFAVDDLAPTGAGTYSNYTGGYADVDEYPDDGATSYIESPLVIGQAETFITSGVVSWSTIYGYCVECNIASRSNLSGASFRLRTRYNGSNYDTDATALSGTSYVLRFNSVVGLSVRKNFFEPVEFGVVEASATASRNHRVSNCLLSVLSLNLPSAAKIGPLLQVM